jgi:hypothetical protein
MTLATHMSAAKRALVPPSALDEPQDVNATHARRMSSGINTGTLLGRSGQASPAVRATGPSGPWADSTEPCDVPKIWQPASIADALSVAAIFIMSVTEAMGPVFAGNVPFQEGR